MGCASGSGEWCVLVGVGSAGGSGEWGVLVGVGIGPGLILQILPSLLAPPFPPSPPLPFPPPLPLRGRTAATERCSGAAAGGE